MRFFTFICLLLLPSIALADAQIWDIRQDESSISFISLEDGKEHTTAIKDFSADIKFSPDDLPASRVTVEIPVRSFSRPDSDILDIMMGPDLFDADNHPNVHFKADHFEHDGDNRYIAHGYLTIKDIEQPFDLPFTLDIADGMADMNATATVLRMPFNVGTGEWSDTSFIANEVSVKIHILADQK